MRHVLKNVNQSDFALFIATLKFYCKPDVEKFTHLVLL